MAVRRRDAVARHAVYRARAERAEWEVLDRRRIRPAIVYTSQLDPLAIGKVRGVPRPARQGQDVDPLRAAVPELRSPADSFGFYNISARKLFDRDQTIGLLAKRPGLYDFQLRWDQIPHTYSTSARSPGNELGNPGFNTLPALRPDSNAWRNGAYVGPIRNQVDPIKASLALTPNKNLDFKADYTHIAKKGGIPRSVSFSGSSGPQREYVSPIDQTINDVRLSQGYASGERAATDVLSFIKSYQANVSYGYSRFNNSIKSTMVDNPQLSVSVVRERHEHGARVARAEQLGADGRRERRRVAADAHAVHGVRRLDRGRARTTRSSRRRRTIRSLAIRTTVSSAATLVPASTRWCAQRPTCCRRPPTRWTS